MQWWRQSPLPTPLPEFDGHWSPYYQIKCHVLNRMKMLPCFVSSVSIKRTMDFPSSQPIGSPAFPKIELLTICNFRQWPKKKIIIPHKFVKFILILSSPFLSLPLHLLKSKCHWERSTFGLIWNVKCSNLLLLPRKSSLKGNFSSSF